MNKESTHFQCPMPKLDFDIITLGHGSGGVLSNRLLSKTVFELLSNPHLDTRHDGAVINLGEEVAFTTDSFVVSPIFFPGGNIGDLAVNGTVNDVAMCGGIPQYISLSLILEEGLKMIELWEILCSIKSSCDDAGVKVVTGDTKVVERGKGDKIFINTTGIGKIHPKASIAVDNIKVGDKIIVSSNIAAHGTCIMARREGLEFETTIKSDTRNISRITTELLNHLGCEIHFFRDPTRGGVATVLNEVSRDIEKEIEIDQSSIPIDNQVAALCEILGLDPLYVANEGAFIAFVEAETATQCVEIINRIQGYDQARIIGAVQPKKGNKVYLRSEVGGLRVVSMLLGEQLPRIC